MGRRPYHLFPVQSDKTRLVSSAQLIDVDEWSVDEDFPIFPVGSKPKRLIRCPERAPQPFLIPGHSYLFGA